MKLISSHEAVTFLSQAAPRPWVQRLLRWMAFDEGLPAYSRKGKVQSFTSVFRMTLHLAQEVGNVSGSELDDAIRNEFIPETAAKLIGRDPHDRFYGEPFVWDEHDEPKQLDTGFFLYASEIDWEAGTLKSDFIPGSGEMSEVFFPDSEFLGTDFEDPEFEVVIEGLSFEFSKIEMLLPSMELGHAAGITMVQNDRRRAVGRPPKWDWEGAMAFVISQAQHPDGLPTGPGAQARIEALISDWFLQQVQETPSPSQVRQRAARIMQMLETPIIR